MNLVAMSIPDDPAELPVWLEQHLVELELAALVAELTAVHGRAEGPSLADLLRGWREAVLDHGLRALPPAILGQLLRRPSLLLELQEIVLIDGGPYWQQAINADAELGTLALRSERRLSEKLGPAATIPIAAARPPAHRRLGWFQTVAVAVASAAAVVPFVYLLMQPGDHQAPSGWGWEALGPAPAGMSAPDYLDRLASAAEDWSKQRPDDPAALAERIGEMRRGCTELIFAKHAPLSDEQKKWLVGKCREWGEKFDKSLEALEDGRPVGDVRDEMDATVKRLVAALHKQADKLRGS